jgi:geranylgeranyl pyrophosphate synthase
VMNDASRREPLTSAMMTESPLPRTDELPRWLDLPLNSPGDGERFSQSLLDPLKDLLSRPSKQFRSRLVHLGYRLAGGRESHPVVEAFAKLVEALHAGSLIVDDIQDGSRMRRGAPALHVRYGLPVALNAGNWLYFWPLAGLRELQLTEAQELEATRLCLDVLLKAHFGQSLDVGTRIDEVPQGEVESVCRMSIRLKTGALTGLSLRLGALAAQADAETQRRLEGFGSAFGSALQMLDDTANFAADHAATSDPVSGYRKRFEDLHLRRPTWIWAVAARSEQPEDFRRFREAVERLPDETFLRPWIELSGLIPRARSQAQGELQQALQELKTWITDEEALSELQNLQVQLEKAY